MFAAKWKKHLTARPVGRELTSEELKMVSGGVKPIVTGYGNSTATWAGSGLTNDSNGSGKLQNTHGPS
ncbi:class IIb bacteriocin, lactobin A/cerein 7B family [Methylobacterium sp. CM6257]